jgi:hypothetical protein
MQTRVIDGFEVALFEDAPEPYIPDVELGKRLGFKRPRAIRQIIKRWHTAGVFRDLRCVSPHGTANPPHGVALGKIPRRGEPAHTQYFLGEADALFVITKSETDLAIQITQKIIDVFMSWRRCQLSKPNTDPAIMRALVEIRDELKANRVLNTHIAKAVGIPLPGVIVREAKSRNRSHSSLEKHLGIRLHIENLFELGRTYTEIVASVQATFHLKISKTSLSRAYQRWTLRTGRTSWSPRFQLLS